MTNTFRERQALRQAASPPPPKPEVSTGYIRPANPDAAWGKALGEHKRATAADINKLSDSFPAVVFDTVVKPAARFFGALEQMNSSVLSAEKLGEHYAARLDSKPRMNKNDIRKMGIPLFAEQAKSPAFFSQWSAVVWTKSHGAYRVKGVAMVDRDRSEPNWRVTLYFNDIPAKASTEITHWKIFDDQDRFVHGATDRTFAMNSGDVLKPSYTINL